MKRQSRLPIKHIRLEMDENFRVELPIEVWTAVVAEGRNHVLVWKGSEDGVVGLSLPSQVAKEIERIRHRKEKDPNLIRLIVSAQVTCNIEAGGYIRLDPYIWDQWKAALPSGHITLETRGVFPEAFSESEFLDGIIPSDVA